MDEPCFGIGLSLSLIYQLTSEDIKQHYIPGLNHENVRRSVARSWALGDRVTACAIDCGIVFLVPVSDTLTHNRQLPLLSRSVRPGVSREVSEDIISIVPCHCVLG